MSVLCSGGITWTIVIILGLFGPPSYWGSFEEPVGDRYKDVGVCGRSFPLRCLSGPVVWLRVESRLRRRIPVGPGSPYNFSGPTTQYLYRKRWTRKVSLWEKPSLNVFLFILPYQRCYSLGSRNDKDYHPLRVRKVRSESDWRWKVNQNYVP